MQDGLVDALVDGATRDAQISKQMVTRLEELNKQLSELEIKRDELSKTYMRRKEKLVNVQEPIRKLNEEKIII